MTDKQIIIDGIDVSKCQHINAYNPKNPICQRGVGVGGSASVCDARCRYADEYRYKQQLKRKEQECEGLKGRLKYIINENKILKDCATDEHIDIVALKNYISTLEFHNDQLKAENDELKEQLELNTANAVVIDMAQRLHNYKQAIEKVREIANRPYLLPCGGDCKQQNCTDKTTENGKHCMELKLIQILQICDEVNDEQ